MVPHCSLMVTADVFHSQTGSGKTYTMGTGFDVSVAEDEQGIIPRAVRQLFQGIERRQAEAREAGIHPPEFKVSAQFLEVGGGEARGVLTSG